MKKYTFNFTLPQNQLDELKMALYEQQSLREKEDEEDNFGTSSEHRAINILVSKLEEALDEQDYYEDLF